MRASTTGPTERPSLSLLWDHKDLLRCHHGLPSTFARLSHGIDLTRPLFLFSATNTATYAKRYIKRCCTNLEHSTSLPLLPPHTHC